MSEQKKTIQGIVSYSVVPQFAIGVKLSTVELQLSERDLYFDHPLIKLFVFVLVYNLVCYVLHAVKITVAR